MDQEKVIIACSDCGAKNRVPRDRLKEGPVCGKCKSALKPDTILIKCPGCGAKNRVIKALANDKPNCGKCHEPLPGIPFYDYVVETTDRNFIKEVLEFPMPVLADFYSNSCGYCHMLTPILQEMAKENMGKLKIAKLNIDNNPMTASRFKVMSTPTMILFKDGKQIDTLMGAMEKQQIEARLRPFLQ